MSTGYSWAWPRIFWWPNALPVPLSESPFQNPIGYIHTNILDSANTLNPNGIQVQVKNRTVYHNLKPLSELLTNPDWQAYDFFSGEFEPHNVYDATNGIEAYYLISLTQPLAIGWVHNLNAYWRNHFYVKNAVTPTVLQNFFGCDTPGVQQLSITGLLPGVDYHVTWFPTRMNDTIHPVDVVDTSQTGSVLLDLSSAPLGDTANLYLDTLHMDYAFIIAPHPVQRSMHGEGAEESVVQTTEWDYELFPNPASDHLNIVLPEDGIVDITLYDLSGRRIRGWNRTKGLRIGLQIGSLAPGAYYVYVSTGEHSKAKPLIIH
jgi:hypothetical protein